MVDEILRPGGTMIKAIILCISLLCFTAVLNADQLNLSKRFVPGAQTASITGNWALWHNPAGLAFMGGGESALAYLYEWSNLGNRHHGGGNIAYNFWRGLTLAGGISTQAAILDRAKANLGTDLSGIFGLAIKVSENSGFGISFLKSHNFLTKQSTPVLVSFGLQIRPFSFLSLGGHYEEVDGAYFAAPNITTGISIRPYKEIFTIGVDGRFVALGKEWSDGFRTHPILSLKTSYRGYSATIGAEFPGLRDGFRKPIFSGSLEFNFAHLGLSFAGLVNPKANNFAVGGHLRTSSEEWPSIARPSGLFVQLTIDHDGTLEKKPASLAARFFAVPEDPLAVLSLLRRIANDPMISGIVLRLNGFNFGDGKTQEWRDAILSLRNAKKQVVVYLDDPSERDYYIASAANIIHMNQYSTLSLRNFQATLIYFADLLHKIGIKADAVVAGSYKTAPRQWTNSRPQKEELEIAHNILNSFYETMITDVAEARNIEPQKLRELFDKGEITPEEAKKAGLIDDIVSPTRDPRQDDNEKNPPFFQNYENRVFKQEKWHAPKKIVVIPITDVIAEGRSLPGPMSWLFPKTGAKDVIDEINNAQDDPNVVGMIVRIDSPGGEASAGHRINQALMDAQKIKPVVTSMSDVAASAGYLIAAGTGHILAMPNTITGSIGVFSLMFSGEKLADKLGIFSKELSPIKNPGPTILRSITDAERKEAQRITDWYYHNFIQAVSTGLKLDMQRVQKNADGHVWLGREALERKLVHELGGFSQSIDRIRTLAEIPDGEDIIIEIRSPGYSEQFSLISGLASLWQFRETEADMKPLSAIAEPYMKALQAYRLNGTPQARMPFDIEWRKR